VVDGQRAGSLEMNGTIEIPVEPGRHTLQVRNGRYSSRLLRRSQPETQTQTRVAAAPIWACAHDATSRSFS
jgi:hypothetical protein